MISEEQIDTLIEQRDSRKKTVERLKENPYYIKWLELKLIMEHGRHIERLLKAEEETIANVEQQVGLLIKQYKEQTQVLQQPVDPLGHPLSSSATPPVVQQPVVQQPPVVQVPPIVPPQQPVVQPPPDVSQQPVVQPPPAVLPQPPEAPAQLPREKTPEETAAETFEINKEDIGTDEDIEFEGLPEFEEAKPDDKEK